MSYTPSAEDIILQHEKNGNYINVDGVRTFYTDTGEGPVVYCIHGVPTSSFLFRKVAVALQQQGFRTIAVDLPGLGLSDRPEGFNFIFSNFGKFCNRLLDRLKVDAVHLLTHDAGTPVGLSMAAQNSHRVKSITILDSMLDVANFRKPLPMRGFEKPILGEAALAMLTPTTFALMMKSKGVHNEDAISHEEVAAYIDLLKREDGGKAFLKIMRNFEKTKAFTESCYVALQNPVYPVQLIWGDDDPFLPYEEYGRQFEDARPGIPVTIVHSKHFILEEQYEIIAAKIREFILPNL